MSKNIINIKDVMAAAVATVANKADNAGARFSHKGGRLHFGETRLKDDKVTAIVVDYGTVNALWPPYDATATEFVPPICFSVASDDISSMVPHPNVKDPQHDNCKSCPMARFEHGPNKNAPACKARRKLMLLPDIDDPEKVATADLAEFSTTPTTSRVWDKYVTGLAAKGLPWWAARTTISVTPPKKAGLYDLEFDLDEPIKDESLLLAIHARIAEANEEVLKPFKYEEEEDLTID